MLGGCWCPGHKTAVWLGLGFRRKEERKKHEKRKRKRKGKLKTMIRQTPA
jgi:hypothetical protein